MRIPRNISTLAATLAAVGALTGCASSVAGTAQPLDPAANYAERQQVADATIHAVVPYLAISAEDLALKACHALDVGASPKYLAREVAAGTGLSQSEVRTVVAASTYGYCIHEWTSTGTH